MRRPCEKVSREGVAPVHLSTRPDMVLDRDDRLPLDQLETGELLLRSNPWGSLVRILTQLFRHL